MKALKSEQPTMPANEVKRLTPLESLIMDSLWTMPQSTVRQVQERLQASKPMAYNTVLTMMRILRDKGFLESEREGRTDVYRAVIGRKQVGKRSLNEVLNRFFEGSAEALVSQLLESPELDTEEIEAIRREVNKKLRT